MATQTTKSATRTVVYCRNQGTENYEARTAKLIGRNRVLVTTEKLSSVVSLDEWVQTAGAWLSAGWRLAY